jgi:hypothetical protein
MTSDPATAPAPADTAAAGSTATTATPNPPAESLLTATPAAAAPDAPAANDWLPEKYRVTKEDGTLDLDASARKMGEGYKHLVSKLGTDEKPPASPDEYKPEGLPDGFDFEQIKADPLYQNFLKGAHAKGLTNAQVSYVIGEYLARTPELAGEMKRLSVDEAKAELGKVWSDPASFDTNLKAANRAASAYAAQGDEPGSINRLMEKFGTDPDFLIFAARVGAEIGEDRSPTVGMPSDAATLNSAIAELRADPAFLDDNHPQHKAVVDKLTKLYEQRHKVTAKTAA